MSEMVAEESQAATSVGVALDQMLWGFAVSQALYVTARLGIVDVLRAVGGSRSRAATTLGVSRSTLYEKLKRYAID